MAFYMMGDERVEALQFTQQNIPAMRRFAPVGINGCRGVFVRPDGSWFDDDKNEWPGEVWEAGLLLPVEFEGIVALELVRENDWVVKQDGDVWSSTPLNFNANYKKAEQ